MAKKRNSMAFLIAVLAVILVGLIILVVALEQGNFFTNPTEPTTTVAPTDPPTDPPTEPPTEPPIVKESTATVGVTGDILFHDRVIKCGWQEDTKTYNYDHIYQHWKKYISAVDYAVANLEVTLCSNDNGYDYKGYPCFNSPDAVPEALKKAGFDMVLTANNHSYDTRNKGFMRTQEVVSGLGLDHIGTRTNVETPNYLVKDINGIKIGMINYTYTTQLDDDGKAYLNGIPLTLEDSQLVNVFNYWKLDEFYAKLSGEMEAMRAAGAEAIVLYIHWGDEYGTTQNSTQTKMAQALCNLGIDVIVGNHAHVPQPVALLTNENDETKKTLCVYSTGNAVSNITRHDKNRPINCEDGMLFSFTFAKYSDGTVILENTDLLPTWVDRTDESDWSDQFIVLPLDKKTDDWQTALGINEATVKECNNSYERTMGIVGEGLAQAQAYYTQHQKDVEAKIGVKN